MYEEPTCKKPSLLQEAFQTFLWVLCVLIILGATAHGVFFWVSRFQAYRAMEVIIQQCPDCSRAMKEVEYAKPR